jgi:hypothetical protein
MPSGTPNRFEAAAIMAFAYPGAGIRFFFYGTKRSIRDLLEDGADINAFAFLWLAGMVLTWASIMKNI